MKQRSLVFLTLFSLLLVLACRNEKTAQTTTTAESDTASATTPGSPGGTAAVPDADTGTTVIVVLEDSSIGVKGETIPPGPANLTASNAGKEVHNLFVEGAGVNRGLDKNLGPGESATLDVMFQPGTYTFYCPVLDHRTKGEQVQVTIK